MQISSNLTGVYDNTAPYMDMAYIVLMCRYVTAHSLHGYIRLNGGVHINVYRCLVCYIRIYVV